MPELAFVFPGQGSQQVGMGLELARTYPAARATFDEADSVLNRKLSQLCFEGPAEALRQTENTQLAVLTCSIAALRILQEFGIAPRVTAGHSLGEYSALVAANVLGFREALELVQYRSSFMAEASGRQACAMAAILGLDEDVLNNFCEEAQSIGVVQVANYNCPGTVDYFGRRGSCTESCGKRKRSGWRQTLPVAPRWRSVSFGIDGTGACTVPGGHCQFRVSTASDGVRRKRHGQLCVHRLMKFVNCWSTKSPARCDGTSRFE